MFIEPEEVLEMNNELRTLKLDELQEIERILHMLSERVGKLARALRYGYAIACRDRQQQCNCGILL